MADDRGLRLYRGVNVQDPIKKKIDAVARMWDAHSKRGPFVLEARPLSRADLTAAVRWITGVSKGQAANPIKTDALRRSTQAVPTGLQLRPQATWESMKAGVRGAMDSLPLDLGDYLPAAASAIGAGGFGRDPVAAFNRRLTLERGQNRYDEATHPAARTVGKAAGTALQLPVPGLAWSRLAAAPRMAQVAPMLSKESSKLAGYGAGAGIVAQAADDIVQRRLSSLGDYVGSGLGGGAGAVTAMYRGPGYAGGITGGVTSLAQDLLNGKVRSTADARAAIDRAAEAAATGNILGVPIAGTLAYRANSFSAKAKGELGEWLAKERSRLRGRKIADRQVRVRVKGGYTRADLLELDGDLVEAKFGYSHRRLKGRQAQAYNELPNYRLDHFTPNDLGAASEVPFGALNYQIYDDR